MDWAREPRASERFVASVAPENEPSLAIVRKLGFVQTGEQWDDEDGLEHVFELEPRAARVAGMGTYRYVVADVFTDTPLAGEPARGLHGRARDPGGAAPAARARR